MQNFNYHSHTERCGHAVGSDEAYVKEAIRNGYRYMGFSDHAPYRNGDAPGERMRVEELFDYIHSVRELQHAYQDQIEIRLGMEIEYFEEQLDELMQYKEEMDYLILGQHGPALYAPEFYDNHSDADVLHYASLIEKACEKGLPDIIAHPDLFMFGKEVWTEACCEAAHRICASAQKHGVILEVNLNGLRYGKRKLGEEFRYTYPYRSFWEIACTYDVDIVYGLDAHAPQKYADQDCFAIVNQEILYDLPLKFRNELRFEDRNRGN